MNICEKIKDMTPEEIAEAACLAMACLACGCDSKDKFEKLRAVIDGVAQMMKEGFMELLLEMPWEQAVWELLGGMAGKG